MHEQRIFEQKILTYEPVYFKGLGEGSICLDKGCGQDSKKTILPKIIQQVFA